MLGEPEVIADTFSAFVEQAGPRLKHALVAALGPEVGREAAAEALAYGWEHWARVSGMDNAAGYLYRVGRNLGKRMVRTGRITLGFPEVSTEMPWVEPGLPAALAHLSRRQRTAVVLVHGAGWSLAETAELMGVSRGAVHKHVERALGRLRHTLEVDREI
ncbi:MAG: RNA polymerase sigma factor [Acidimicrobiia bacterium]